MTRSPSTEGRAQATLNDPRWPSIVARDASADGKFYYGVKTTGVYCRPACAARLARPENVEFFEVQEAAEKAGYRPCKRCKPRAASVSEENASRIAKACRLIENSETTLSLLKLAKAAHMSVYHFHRTFKTITGLTPNQYAAAHRGQRMRSSLEGSDSVTNAIYEAGFNSSSRFYESANDVLGMTPSQFKAGGAKTDIFFAVARCSLGPILVAQSRKGACAILIGDDPVALVRDLQDRFPNANLIGDEGRYQEVVAKVIGLIEYPEIGLICRSTFAARRSSSASGRRFSRFRPARPRRTPRSRRRSESRRRSVQSPGHAPPTFLRSQFPAIVSSGRTDRSRAIAGVLSERVRFLKESRTDEDPVSN